jgi:hypothetical protein
MAGVILSETVEKEAESAAVDEPDFRMTLIPERLEKTSSTASTSSAPQQLQRSVVFTKNPPPDNNTRVCRYWNGSGGCPRGNNCGFKHISDGVCSHLLPIQPLFLFYDDSPPM